MKMGSQPKDVVDTRWASARKEVEGAKTVEARLVAKGYQLPDLRNGNAGIAGCVSGRSPHAQPISLGVLKKWAFRSLDIENVLLQADVFGREVYVHVPCEGDSKDDRRVLILRAPAYGHADAPVARRRFRRKCPVNSVESSSGAGLGFEPLSSDPRLPYVFRKSGGAVGAIATCYGDILGCGGPDLP